MINNQSYIILNSVSELRPEHKNHWIFCGSHGGVNAAEHVLSYKISGIVFNDAGIGKDNAGIAGIDLLNEYDIPAATVKTSSARIGDGYDTLHSGVISATNSCAKKYTIYVGMNCLDILKQLNLSSSR